jgi:hypothetical protein
MPGEQKSLHVGQQPEGDAFIDKGMDDLLLFTVLPGDKNLLPGRILQLHCTGFGAFKIAGCNLLSVYERERKAINEHWAELLHQIECKAGASGAIHMQVPHAWIESDSL